MLFLNMVLIYYWILNLFMRVILEVRFPTYDFFFIYLFIYYMIVVEFNLLKSKKMSQYHVVPGAVFVFFVIIHTVNSLSAEDKASI